MSPLCSVAFQLITDLFLSQWNSTFGTPPASSTTAPKSTRLNPPVSGAQELPEYQAGPPLSLSANPQSLQPQQYSGPQIPSFVSPSMWQESVASVYEGGLKRQWNYDEDNLVSKRAR